LEETKIVIAVEDTLHENRHTRLLPLTLLRVLAPSAQEVTIPKEIFLEQEKRDAGTGPWDK